MSFSTRDLEANERIAPLVSCSSSGRKKEIIMEQMNKQTAAAGDQKKSNFTDKVGDALEKVGSKISDAGATSIGKAIHDAGDRIEKTHKNPNHPNDGTV